MLRILKVGSTTHPTGSTSRLIDTLDVAPVYIKASVGHLLSSN